MSGEDIGADEHIALRLEAERDRERTRKTHALTLVVGQAVRAVGGDTRHVRADRAGFLRLEHNVVLGQSACPSCHRPIEAGDRDECPTPKCNRPWPRRCVGVRDGDVIRRCMAFLDPVPHYVTLRSGEHRVVWDAPEHQCQACIRVTRRQPRRDAWIASLPEGESDKLVKCVDEYRVSPWRQALDSKLEAWLTGEALPSLFVWGAVGCGKTVAIARASYRAMVETQCVSSLCWTTEDDLIDAYKLQYGDGVEPAKRVAARGLLERLETAELAVVDEMFSGRAVKDSWTPTAARDVGKALRRRLDGGRRTLFTSNADPRMAGKSPSGIPWRAEESLWAISFDERMADRARFSMDVMRVQGPSMRVRVGSPGGNS